MFPPIIGYSAGLEGSSSEPEYEYYLLMQHHRSIYSAFGNVSSLMVEHYTIGKVMCSRGISTRDVTILISSMVAAPGFRWRFTESLPRGRFIFVPGSSIKDLVAGSEKLPFREICASQSFTPINPQNLTVLLTEISANTHRSLLHGKCSDHA